MAGSWWPEVRGGDLVGYLTDEEHARLLAITQDWEVTAGTQILSRGTPSRSLILVEEGVLEVVEESMGETVVLAAVTAGGVVGEVGFVDGRARTHNVRASTACRLRRLPRERLLDLVKDDPTLFAKLTIALAELLADRFRKAVDELQPVRAFAASLREPMTADEEPHVGFDEIDEPLPEGALALIRAVAEKAQDDVAGL